MSFVAWSLSVNVGCWPVCISHRYAQIFHWQKRQGLSLFFVTPRNSKGRLPATYSQGFGLKFKLFLAINIPLLIRARERIYSIFNNTKLYENFIHKKGRIAHPNLGILESSLLLLRLVTESQSKHGWKLKLEPRKACFWNPGTELRQDGRMDKLRNAPHKGKQGKNNWNVNIKYIQVQVVRP